MSYTQGGKIEASDFNTFRSRVINVIGLGSADYGYGQETLANTLPNIIKDVDIVKSSEWTALRSVIQKVANHQGVSVTLPSVSDVAQNARVDAEAFDAAISIIEINRISVNVSDTATIANTAIATRSTAWNNVIDCELKVGFPNIDAARWFFNTGGKISYVMGHPNTGLSQDQDDAWRAIFTSIGTLFVDAFTYYGLSTTYSLIYNGNNVGSAYSGGLYAGYAAYSGYTGMNENDVFVYAKKDTAGNLYIKIEMVDSYTTPDLDSVASGTNVRFSTRLMSGAVSQLSSTLHYGVNIFTPATDITYTFTNNL